MSVYYRYTVRWRCEPGEKLQPHAYYNSRTADRVARSLLNIGCSSVRIEMTVRAAARESSAKRRPVLITGYDTKPLREFVP